MKIYLAGSVPKGDKASKLFNDWRQEYSGVLKKIFKDAKLIDPYHKKLDESDCFAVVGGDSLHIKTADLIVVNAEKKIGAGTAMELVIAKYFSKPVVTVLPNDTHHRRSNVTFHGKLIKDWIHPFIGVFSDFVVGDVQEIEKIKKRIFDLPKKINIIDEAIDYFRSK